MTDPSGPVKSSVSKSGELVKVPEDPFSLTMTSDDGEITGVLEKWGEEAWIYARSDSLVDLN